MFVLYLVLKFLVKVDIKYRTFKVVIKINIKSIISLLAGKTDDFFI